MPDLSPNLVGIIAFAALIGLIPLGVVTMTAFLKISVVLFLIRNALGIQQSPPNLVLHAIALVLTVYVTAPLMADLYGRVSSRQLDLNSVQGLTEAADTVRQPLRDMAATAAGMVLEMSEGRTPTNLRIDLATELVVRESTGPVRGA